MAHKMRLEYAQERTLRVLSDWQPMSAQAIAESTGEVSQTVVQRMRRLFAAGQVHIAGYEIKASGKHWPMYSIGKSKNTPPPRKMTNMEIWNRYYDKAKIERPDFCKNRINRAAAVEKHRLDTDPAYRAHRFAQIAAHKRKRRASLPGYTPMALRLRKNMDEIAMQFGITWRFQNTRRKAA